ncbi:hypothetical protein [Priestia megaterium]|uniref:hypothetical protein n=1 Tax=Priestia megaterium TaxID=1404 RepID=UPI0018660DC2|nr:hypothetical protein [Priestia megaterium]MBE2973422.1 hypothetical protein [Priestia megaterium]
MVKEYNVEEIDIEERVNFIKKNPEYARELNLFKYFIILPTASYRRESIFNRFDYNLLNSVNFLEMIARFPYSISEFKGEWPIPSHNRFDRYKIYYVFEENVDFELLSQLIYGAVFVTPNLNSKTIERLITSTYLPIIGSVDNEKIYSLNDQAVSEVYKHWLKQERYFFEKSESILGLKETEVINIESYDSNKTSILGYNAPSMHLLNPLTFSINRYRGLYEKVTEGLFIHDESDVEKKEILAREKVVESFKQVIVESYLNNVLCSFAGSEIDEKDLNNLRNMGIDSNELKELCESRDNKNYENIVTIMLDNWDKLNYLTDIVLCVPTVNYEMINTINSAFGSNKIPKKLLKVIYDSATYFYYVNNSVFKSQSLHKEEKNLKQFTELISERGLETSFLSSLYLFYSLAQRAPFVRTSNVPSGEFYRLAFNLSKYMEHMARGNKYTKFTSGIRDLVNVIKKSIPEGVLEVTSKTGHNVKVLSDLPLEWVDYEGVPLAISNRVSRIPITPGNGLITHYMHTEKLTYLDGNKLKVLIINTLSPGEEIFSLGKSLFDFTEKTFEGLSANILYQEIRNKVDFISIIEKEKPDILIYYGHGKYNVGEQVGKLVINEEKKIYIDSIELENMSWHPPITILGACETQIMHGSHLNIANLFLTGGSVSVIGTFFPVYAINARNYIMQIMLVLSKTFKKETSFKSFDDIILQANRFSYIYDSIHSLENYLNRRKKKIVDFYQGTLISDFFHLGESKKFRGVELFRNRDLLFLELFKNYPELTKAYKSILSNGLLIPESLYYSSLGSPEKIKILN